MIADSEATTKAATIAISKSVDFISSRESRVVKTLNIVRSLSNLMGSWMGSITGHKIDYNGVEALRDQRHIPSKN